jgi:CelD/BcsL family acetyltransferase involved in cellulose biosynthesis
LRACYKYLERDNLVIDFRVIQSPKDLADSLNLFYLLHKARTKVRYFDVFSDPRARSFFNEFASSMAARGELRLFQIAFKDVVVATRIGFQFGNELYLYHSGNDPAWDNYSIMTTLLAEIMKWAINEGIVILNLSTGNDRSKTRWKPTEILYNDGVEVAPGLASDRISRMYDFLRDQTHPASPMRKLVAQIRNGVRSAGARSNETNPTLDTD